MDIKVNQNDNHLIPVSFDISSKLIQNIANMTNQNRKYLLKKDRILQTTFGGDKLTNDNLTDEIAEKILRQYPALIKHFEVYPEDIKPKKIEYQTITFKDKGGIEWTLWEADPDCNHELDPNCWSGIKCLYCHGWFCY